MKKLKFLLIAIFAVASVANAATINFSAGIANNAAGIGGADLAPSDTISIGTWDGSAFSVLGTSSNDNIAFGPGFFSGTTGKIATTAGAQLAFQWTTTGAETGVAFYDITTGGDAGRVAQWTLKGGDGGGTDNNINAIDLADLTVGIAGVTLDAAATLINMTFSGSNPAGVPSFGVTAVPEPSAYALLSGLLALSFVMVRRRA